MSEETLILHAAGALPGIPGEHGPGTYLVDYEARTIRPYPVETSQETTEVPAQEIAQEPFPDVVPVPETLPATE